MAVSIASFDGKTGKVPQHALIADAGATYTATEQGIVNAILVALKDAGIVART